MGLVTYKSVQDRPYLEKGLPCDFLGSKALQASRTPFRLAFEKDVRYKSAEDMAGRYLRYLR